MSKINLIGINGYIESGTTFIYTLSHPTNKEVRYIGKTNNPTERFKNHLNKKHNINSHKRNWINKLLNNGLKPVFEIIDEVPISEWIFWETYWINQFKAWGFSLVNHTYGGEGLTFGNNTSFSKGSIPWNKDKNHSEETKAKLKLVNLGNIQSEETRLKRSKSMLGKNKGNRSLETIEKLKPTFFKEGHQTWNKNKSGYKLSGKKTSKTVIQLDLNGNIIKEYIGIKEASIELDCIPENIRRACIGLSKSAKGFKWKYKNQ